MDMHHGRRPPRLPDGSSTTPKTKAFPYPLAEVKNIDIDVRIQVQGILRRLNIASRVQDSVHAVAHGLPEQNDAVRASTSALCMQRVIVAS